MLHYYIQKSTLIAQHVHDHMGESHENLSGHISPQNQKKKRKNRINSVHNVANLKMFLYCDICYIYINILKELNFFFFFNDNLL